VGNLRQTARVELVESMAGSIDCVCVADPPTPVQKGLLVSVPPLVEPAESLSIDEVRRYSRHLIIPDVAMTGQKRLKNAKVLCIGAGGLGSPALMYLAAAGVGTLGIVEFDTVDESNLQRQIIHGQSDIGRSKAQSAADSVREINPLVQVNVHELHLDSSNVMDLFAQYDLIVDGTDNFATRYLVNDAAVLLGKPYVWGSIYRFDGQASVFWAEYGPCYRCLYPEPPPPGMVPSCAEGGVLGVLCASIGSIQVNEAIKLITGIGEPLVGSLMVYDALEMEYRKIKVRKDPNCAVCGEHPTVTELIDYEEFCGVVSDEAQQAAAGSTITVNDLKELLDSDKPIELIDVREPAEWEIVHIPGAKLIPKDEILRGDALASLPQDRQIVMYCKTGVRSAETLAAVKNAGFKDAVHVFGGVTAWVREIDPSLPSY
jgi:sulfur-carrier protein adenylyltransferase/sulfurtransferase